MTTDEVLRKLEPWRARHARPAWKPVVADGDGPATAAKFCGTPWVGPDVPWPDCGRCKHPLQLFLQLDLGGLPEELGQKFGEGLLQLFYCTRDACQGYGGWEPFADDLSRVRVVRPKGPGLTSEGKRTSEDFPAKRIVDWERFLDFPAAAEHEVLGLKYHYQDQRRTVRLVAEGLDLTLPTALDPYLSDTFARSLTGDKLGGWPDWVQGVEYPDCPRCGRRMGLVFQVDSEHNIPFMFEDVGCGHVTQCPEHQDVVAFGWACS